MSGAHRVHGRLLAVLVLVLLAFGGLVGRLGQVQLAGAEGFTDGGADATALDTRTLVVPALRGRILDRGGRVLAENRTSTVVTLERRVVADDRARAEAQVRDVARVLGVDAGPLLGRTWLCGEEGAPPAPTCWSGSPQVPVPLVEGVDAARALSLVEQPGRFPGVAVTSRPVRHYPRPDGVSAAQLVGYLGPVTAEEVEASDTLVGDDLVGRAGLEQQYDAALRGVPGRTVVAVDARGLVTHVVSRTPPVPGRDLVTSLDVRVQASAERALRREMRRARARGWAADSGAVVVLDPRDGAVAALASAPTYDPNVWTGGISQADYARLTDPDRGTPLLSRATDVGFAPASTMKVASVAAAVADGRSLTADYDCPSRYRIGDRWFRNYETREHGAISLATALEISCDTVFYDLAYASWLRQGGLGAAADVRDPFAATARRLGLGRPTGVDLPHEDAGRVPDRSWRRATWEDQREQLCRRADTGYPEVRDRERRRFLRAVAEENCASGWQLRAGDAANFSVGQGDVLATPLQMAVVYGAVANGGSVLTPRVGTALVDPAGGAEQAVEGGRTRRAPMSRSTVRYVQDALARVPVTGTAAGVFADMPRDWPVAGKTGTAEVVGKRDTSWFVSYAPAGAPRWVVAAVVGQGGTGSSTAAPVAESVHRTLRALG
ncbi:penicillin-binding protein 2 [Phycicoccus sp. BSK3Z-2]|uniref:Penicillin-binding protein 2 n=1 Tax=Phycicoccus avicenniae TaxID=2828860 RepID=A0A941I0U8_9MICO|nr:penicillin-binding protein 2 [Phycicoccus avicenniae]MBR7744502.1 penicillin-binding protein 2 [Phycicoccus avicenniae]